MVIRHPCQPKTSDFVGTQRQIMVICHPCQPETSESVGTLNKSWSSAPSPSRDNRVRWQAKMNHGHLHLRHPETIKFDGMRRPSWSSVLFYVFKILQFPLPSKDNQVRWRADTIMVNYFFTFRRRQCLQSLHSFKRQQ